MIRERGGFEVYSKRATSVFGVVAMGLSASGGPAALADNEYFQPGNLLLSHVVYDNIPKMFRRESPRLPPNCTSATPCVTATNDDAHGKDDGASTSVTDLNRHKRAYWRP